MIKIRATEVIPKLDSLPGPQRALWPELGATPENFTLYGGTALAFGDLGLGVAAAPSFAMGTGLRVASLLNIAGTEVSAVQKRTGTEGPI